MYEQIGQIIVYIIWISVILIIFSLFFGYIALKRRIVLYSFFSEILDFFYMPLKTIYGRFGNEEKLDRIMVGLKNKANKKKYEDNKKRILLAPHHLRSPDCRAPGTREGIQCKSCGKCLFTELKKKAGELNIKLYILTGKSIIRYLTKENKGAGILIVEGPGELNMSMRMIIPKNIPVYGIVLNKDGYCTKKEIGSIYRALGIGLDK